MEIAIAVVLAIGLNALVLWAIGKLGLWYTCVKCGNRWAFQKVVRCGECGTRNDFRVAR